MEDIFNQVYDRSQERKMATVADINITSEGMSLNAPGPAEQITKLREPLNQAEFQSIQQTVEDAKAIVPGLLSGAASATIGLPGDIVALGKGLFSAVFPDEDETRVEAFINDVTEISGKYGSEAVKGVFRDLAAKAGIEGEALEDAMSVGELGGIGGIVKKAPDIGKGIARAASDYASGAEARIAERATGTTLTSGVDPTEIVDQAIVGTKNLLAKPEERIIFEMAPENTRAHKSPPQLLVKGNGEKAITPVTQAYNANNKVTNFENIDALHEQFPNALASSDEWLAMEQSAMGGGYLPIPPMQAIRYSQDPNLMADKLRQLTPELKAGVDEGFEYVNQIRNIYTAGQADPKMTADLFVWGILSRGAGPAQQEAAFLDIMADAQPVMEKVVKGEFNEADMAQWTENMSKVIPDGSPGKQVTMNVNAAGKLLFELAKMPQGSNQTVLEILHEMVSDPDISAKIIRRKFMELTDSAGIDNKVVSFILLVAGRDDVLVMDRIQGRHLWDDGRHEGANIYDGFYKEGTTVQEGLLGIFKGPRGILVTEMLEDGMRPNVQKAYEMVGRPQDASLGRFHWETWVIEGEQVVSHSTLDSIAKNNPVGGSVVEGKTDEFASGFRYIRGEQGPVQEYPLSDGTKAYMTPTRAKEFLAFIKKPKNGIVPGNFKVTERADIPWYERTEVNRGKLDEAARNYANATADGNVLPSTSGANKSKNTTGSSGGGKKGVRSGASNGGADG